MHEVRAAIADYAEPREHRYLVLEGRERLELRHDLVTRADFARHPARAAGRRVGQTQAPEIRAEPYRQRRAIGERGAVAIEERIEHR